ncbi:MAG: alanyl-tRNA editing protein [Spirochaetota bacterium]
MTKAIYYEDPHKTRFEARVISTEAAAKNRVWVELDRTCFYPEGGGQPADRGWIQDIAVQDVKKADGRIYHLLAEEPSGEIVEGRVDEEMRIDYMQQHTGQHIISAAMVEVGGYETVSVHQGEEYTTVEFSAENIPAEDLERAESLANEIVGENRPVNTFHAESNQAGELGLRRPPKFDGTIRIVEIEDFDRVACGGVHATRTGAVGIIKLVGTERIRGNVRTIWKIGDRAFDDYRLKTEVVNTLVDAFSAKPHELPERAAKLEDNLKQAEWEMGRLQKRLAGELAERLLAGATGEGPRIVTHHFDGEPKELFREVAEALCERPGVAACLTNEAEGRLQWIFLSSEGVTLDFAMVKTELLPIIEGKGGGKPPIRQGVGNRPEGAGELAQAFLNRFEELSR